MQAFPFCVEIVLQGAGPDGLQLVDDRLTDLFAHGADRRFVGEAHTDAI